MPRPTFTLSQLLARPTIAQGQFDNIKYDDGAWRVWVSRMSRADGACCDAHVTFERLSIRHGWQTKHEYHTGQGVVVDA